MISKARGFILTSFKLYDVSSNHVPVGRCAIRVKKGGFSEFSG